jgi:hypothetical protein
MGNERFVEIKGVRYPRIIIHWVDIIGDCTTVLKEEAEELKCPHLITEGFLFDVFEDDGERYVRTFATYELGGEIGFGDRNCFPLNVLTRESRRAVEFGLIMMGKSK